MSLRIFRMRGIHVWSLIATRFFSLAIKANIVQLAILGNHLNGKDTHVRHVRIFGPKRSVCLRSYLS